MTGPSLLVVLAGVLTALVVALAGGRGRLDRLRAAPGRAEPRPWPPGTRPARARRAARGPAWRAVDLIRRTMRWRDRNPPVPMPLVLDVVAAVLEAGAPPARALATVAACLPPADDPVAAALLMASRSSGVGLRTPGSPAGSEPALRALLEALDLAASTGLGPAALVRGAAEQERRRRAAAQLLAARRLSVFVVLPMALCLLPAFVLLAIVPVVLDLLTAL